MYTSVYNVLYIKLYNLHINTYTPSGYIVYIYIIIYIYMYIPMTIIYGYTVIQCYT